MSIFSCRFGIFNKTATTPSENTGLKLKIVINVGFCLIKPLQRSPFFKQIQGHTIPAQCLQLINFIKDNKKPLCGDCSGAKGEEKCVSFFERESCQLRCEQ